MIEYAKPELIEFTAWKSLVQGQSIPDCDTEDGSTIGCGSEDNYQCPSAVTQPF